MQEGNQGSVEAEYGAEGCDAEVGSSKSPPEPKVISSPGTRGQGELR